MRQKFLMLLLALAVAAAASGIRAAENADKWELHIVPGPDDDVHECNEGRRIYWNWVAATSLENDFSDDNLFSLNCSLSNLNEWESRYWLEFEPDSEKFTTDSDAGAGYAADIFLRFDEGWNKFGTVYFLANELCGWSEANVTAKSVRTLMSAQEIKFIPRSGNAEAIVQITEDGADKISKWFHSCEAKPE